MAVPVPCGYPMGVVAQKVLVWNDLSSAGGDRDGNHMFPDNWQRRCRMKPCDVGPNLYTN